MRAWPPLGFIANEKHYFSAAEWNVNDTHVKNECFHTQLRAILKSYKEAQQPGALYNIPLQLGTLASKSTIILAQSLHPKKPNSTKRSWIIRLVVMSSSA